MRLVKKRKMIAAFLLLTLYILKKAYFVRWGPGEMEGLGEFFYYSFLYTGAPEGKFNFPAILDFVVYQCILVIFLGVFFRDDIFQNAEMIFSRVKKRQDIFFKEIGKILFNACFVYSCIYGVMQAVMLKINGYSFGETGKRNLHIGFSDVTYFLYGMFFFCTYIVLINVWSIFMDIKYIFIILVVAELAIENMVYRISAGTESHGIAVIVYYLKTAEASCLPYAVISITVIFVLVIMLGFEFLKKKEIYSGNND